MMIYTSHPGEDDPIHASKTTMRICSCAWRKPEISGSSVIESR